jgi:hypothetical protein
VPALACGIEGARAHVNERVENRHRETLRRIIQAEDNWKDEPREFVLRWSPHEDRREVDHPTWDRSWAVPSEHTIDDLAELGFVRIGEQRGKDRTFVATMAGRSTGRSLIDQLNGTTKGSRAPSAPAVLAWLVRLEETGPDCFDVPSRLLDRAVGDGLIDSEGREAPARRILGLIDDGYLTGDVYDFDQATVEQSFSMTRNLAVAMRGHSVHRDRPADVRTWAPLADDDAEAGRDVRDVFISHASEDKGAVARPLAEALRSLGLSVWYDEYELRVGDRLSAKIDRGLANSRSGVVIVSPAFIRKPWPRRELSGLVARETSTGESVILPVWHGVSRDEVLKFSPPLADVLAVDTSSGLDAVVDALLPAVTERRERVDDTGQPLAASEM